MNRFFALMLVLLLSGCTPMQGAVADGRNAPRIGNIPQAAFRCTVDKPYYDTLNRICLSAEQIASQSLAGAKK